MGSTSIPSLSPFFLQSILSADLNHDGYPDLVGTYSNGNFNGPSTIDVFINNGNGTFGAGVPYLGGKGSYAVAFGDFNLDGNTDIAVTNSGGLFVLTGQGDGTFPTNEVVSASADLSAVKVADFNGDGIPDLVVSHTLSATLSVYLGRGDGTFGSPSTVSLTGDAYYLTVGDFNGDGVPDLAVAAGLGIQVLPGNGDGTFGSGTIYPASSVSSLTAADLNHDGVPDIVWGSSVGTVNVMLDDGKGGFAASARYPADYSSSTGGPASESYYLIQVSDFDGDGNLDVASFGGEPSISFGNGERYAARSSPV